MNGDTVTVAAPGSGRIRRLRHSEPALRVTARVPLDGALSLRLAAADARCAGRYAAVEVIGAAADVEVDEVTGDARVKTASGDVRVGRVGGAAQLRSASGDLTLGYAAGDVSVHSQSGTVGLAEAAASVQASTASGDIRLGTAHTGTTSLRSVSGDLTVGVAVGTGVWLDLRTVSGDTRSDLHIDPTSPAATASLRLHVRTVSGDITVRRVPATAMSGPSADRTRQADRTQQADQT
jgi:hypothetical protein